MLIFYSESDLLANPTDFPLLEKHFPESTIVKHIEGWGHLDFVWSENVAELAYDEIVDFITGLDTDMIEK